MAAAAPVIAKAIVGTVAAGAVANKLAPDIPSPQPVAASETEPQKAAKSEAEVAENALSDLRKKEANQLRARRRSTILTSPSGDDSQLGVNRPSAGRGASLLG